MFFRIIILVFISVLLQSCDKQKQQFDSTVLPVQPKSRNIAVFIPLSGIHQHIGQSIQNVIEMILFYNKSENITFSFYDTTNLKNELQNLNFENIDIIVGPVFAKNIALIKKYKPNNITILSLSNDVTQRKRDVFIFGIDPRKEIENILKFAINNGGKSFVSIIPNDAYGKATLNTITMLSKLYQEVSFHNIQYNDSTKDLSEKISLLNTLDLEYIFIPKGGQELSRVISDIHQKNIDISNTKFIGTEQWDDGKSHQIVTINGSYISTFKSKNYNNFLNQYNKLYKNNPTNIDAVVYDVINMLFSLIHIMPADPISTEILINKLKFYGISGEFSLHKGGIVNRNLLIAKLTSKGVTT